MSWNERHKSVQEIAELWAVSPATVRALFESEPGVMKIERPETRFKRGYVTLRIPETVMKRVHERWSRKAA